MKTSKQLLFIFVATLIGATFILQTSCSTTPPKPEAPPSSAGEPQLLIKAGKTERRFSRAELLASPLLKRITVERDPAYGNHTRVYSAVPFASLFAGIKFDPNGTLVFSCLDGFSAPIALDRALNVGSRAAVAYIAVESESEKWAPIKKGKPSAGPFYLVWQNPELSRVMTEEWPFQLSSFEVKPSVEVQFPHVVPAADVPAGDPIRSGYRSFLQNCFACHTMNREGTSHVGPDLNVPSNPTQYMDMRYFVKLVRNPQSLRHWPEAKMRGFSVSEISQGELYNIISYLEHMAKHKVGVPEEQP